MMYYLNKRQQASRKNNCNNSIKRKEQARKDSVHRKRKPQCTLQYKKKLRNIQNRNEYINKANEEKENKIGCMS